MTPKKAPKRKSKAARKKPSPNGNNGRDKSGKFAKGNPGGPGNPHARQIAKFRAAALNCEAAKPENVEAVMAVLLRKALDGDMAAIKEYLDRVVGKATQPVEADVSVNWRDKTPDEIRAAVADELTKAGYRVEPPDE